MATINAVLNKMKKNNTKAWKIIEKVSLGGVRGVSEDALLKGDDQSGNIKRIVRCLKFDTTNKTLPIALEHKVSLLNGFRIEKGPIFETNNNGMVFIGTDWKNAISEATGAQRNSTLVRVARGGASSSSSQIARPEGQPQQKGKGKKNPDSLLNMIQANIIQPGDGVLSVGYKKKNPIIADLLSNGKIKFQNKMYDNPTAFTVEAKIKLGCKTKRMTFNGWREVKYNRKSLGHWHELYETKDSESYVADEHYKVPVRTHKENASSSKKRRSSNSQSGPKKKSKNNVTGKPPKVPPVRTSKESASSSKKRESSKLHSQRKKKRNKNVRTVDDDITPNEGQVVTEYKPGELRGQFLQNLDFPSMFREEEIQVDGSTDLYRFRDGSGKLFEEEILVKLIGKHKEIFAKTNPGRPQIKIYRHTVTELLKLLQRLLWPQKNDRDVFYFKMDKNHIQAKCRNPISIITNWYKCLKELRDKESVKTMYIGIATDETERDCADRTAAPLRRWRQERNNPFFNSMLLKRRFDEQTSVEMTHVAIWRLIGQDDREDKMNAANTMRAANVEQHLYQELYRYEENKVRKIANCTTASRAPTKPNDIAGWWYYFIVQIELPSDIVDAVLNKETNGIEGYIDKNFPL